MQHGQLLQLGTCGPDGQPTWAYRLRLGGRGARRIQRGGYLTRADAEAAMEAELDRQRRSTRTSLTLAELVDEYLDQHDAQPETTAKLRWLLSKAVAAFGDLPIDQLDPRSIAAWRISLPAGHRFEATQALRQTLARAVEWRLIERNPAKVGVDNPQPPRREMLPLGRPDLLALAAQLDRQDAAMVLLAAATGLRPGELIALEHRDVDRAARLLHVRRAFRLNRVKCTKTDHARAVPLQRRALEALDHLPTSASTLLFPAPEGGHLDLHNWRPRIWRPAQARAGISPIRRVYDLRHTFAADALRAGLGTFELSRYMGTSLVNIDRTYGHLARDGIQHAVATLDAATSTVDAGGRSVDAAHDSDDPRRNPDLPR